MRHKILGIFAFFVGFCFVCGVDFALGANIDSSEGKEYLRTSKNKSGKRETPPNESSEALPKKTQRDFATHAK